VITNPLEAQNEGIFATPSIVKMCPPRKKILGDFTNMEKVFEKLGISSSQ